MKPKMSMTIVSSFPDKRSDFCDRLDRAYLVVREHDTDENCVRADRVAHIFDAYNAVVIDRQPRNFPAFLF